MCGRRRHRVVCSGMRVLEGIAAGSRQEAHVDFAALESTRGSILGGVPWPLEGY